MNLRKRWAFEFLENVVPCSYYSHFDSLLAQSLRPLVEDLQNPVKGVRLGRLTFVKGRREYRRLACLLQWEVQHRLQEEFF